MKSLANFHCVAGQTLYRNGLDSRYIFQQQTVHGILDGNSETHFSDAEILEMLAFPVFLASGTAQNLMERGVSEYISV